MMVWGNDLWMVVVPKDWVLQKEGLDGCEEIWAAPQLPQHLIDIRARRLGPSEAESKYRQAVWEDFEAAMGPMKVAEEGQTTIDGVPASLRTYRLSGSAWSGFTAFLAVAAIDGVATHILLVAPGGDDAGHRALFDAVTGSYSQLTPIAPLEVLGLDCY